ncbi:hypothetical protein NLU13_2541 [Sarocladium strictum]|uniref:DUF3669 domain-containing protein n=1 Tax=Sarocladium strictum TaxID=5046 RepID=A0AA39GL77_SARSR|nr:hypothetical protein NLU13_2541 [Sarocladium strictum]
MAQGQGGLRKIGFGQCGLILESRLGVVVLKLCKAGYSDGLWNDCLAHSRVAEAFRVRHSDRPDVLIPRIYAWVAQEDSAWWADHSEVIPRKKAEFPQPSRVLITERIPRLSCAYRDLFIDLFCPPANQEQARACDANRDCLARVYLGRKSPSKKSCNFTLRNFNLHLDQMRMLGMPVKKYARSIAEALAVIHWGANVTGYDIEFVLGGPSSSAPEDPSTSTPNTALSAIEPPGTQIQRKKTQLEHQLWVLDFNLCGMWEARTALEQPGILIECLVEAFFENDPYYPLPLAEDPEDQRLWVVFKQSYKSTAEQVLESSDRRLEALPDRFLRACEGRERRMLASGRGHWARDQKH